MEKKNNNMDSFIRWQGRTIEQMGYAINVLLITTIAIIGFVVNQLLKNELCCYHQLLLLGGLSVLILCFIIILILILNRLLDFRITTQIAKKREKENEDKIRLEKMRDESRLRGRATWFLLYASVILLCVGSFLIGLGFIGQLIS